MVSLPAKFAYHCRKLCNMEFLHSFQKHFEHYLAEYSFLAEPRGLYEPIDYIMRLGGKRLRPVALLMAAGGFGRDPQEALPAALAFEVFHNFSLVHDDIMDEAPLRRGKPAVHTKYDLNTGILSGDMMLIQSYDLLVKASPVHLLAPILQRFNQTAREVCEGQQMDVDFEKSQSVTIDHYLRMIELKTSVLFAACLEVGALLGGASQEDARKLYEYGRHLGIAFQIQDDILDTYGDPQKFGKKVGGDIVQNKKTFLVLTCLEQASQADRQALGKLMSEKTAHESEKIAAVRSIFDRVGVQQLAETAKKSFKNQGLDYLEQTTELDPETKTAFLALADYLLGREQ